MAMARENNNIEKIAEYRHNIKQLALKGKLSKQTRAYKRKILLFIKMKKLWLIWARTLDHRVGKNDEDQPDIPILTLNKLK